MFQHNSVSMGKRYNYSAFGIQFESDIVLPELHTCTGGSADVKILFGIVPSEIHSPHEKNDYYQIAESKFLFRVDGVASYYVTNGEQVVVQLFNRDLREVRLYLLGTVMGVLLMQRGILPIHGSTVVIEGCCIIFVGVSGAGKSTVAAALRKNGHALLADDISAVKFDKNGLPWVASGYPQQKLWQDSASMLGIDTTPLQRLYNDMDKYAVPVPAGFWGHPMLLNAIYEINVQPDNLSIIPVIGAEKVATIMNHTYRSGFLEGLGLKFEHFKKCVAMAKCIPVFRLTRPNGVPSLDQQVDILERHHSELFGISETN
ncbi:Serine kinase of the HPr protein, regulates carbohydrate metabolism [Desulfosporosinus sp. I2]|uniref:hypothetical protein n=1 Tax=Desulfosporosinus sp. I2 TaxID=1617025 RepID=UPI0005F044CB|nr:hypothetical protein [Desulfosporosinus sp. I2]KJR46648.1 Serine kinase of the HPr protein, regulates carbohydrate metabolism [Desulfosporosinus sp. I2]